MSRLLPLIFFLFSIKNYAQVGDSLHLPPAVLSDSFIVKYKPVPAGEQFVSATRSEEKPADLPFTTHIITAEEILRFGFVTLADVLKAAPGVRVSQPGNALEGETFMMRGLLGNQYVKILINDVPLKPTIALGMAIAEQLPIRQAERIEILYGPATTIYGNEACAGVVNIILKQSERPLFTQADLSFGRFGYNNLDVMFGGKIGKDKRIFRFSLFGSATVRERTNFNLDPIKNLDNYLLFNESARVYDSNPNNRAEPGPLQNTPIVSPIGHESRVFGLQLKYRGLDFSYFRMRRLDHTSLGLNPLAFSYSNSSNRLGEQTDVFSAGFRLGKKRLKTQNTFSLILYQIDAFSTATHVWETPMAVFQAVTVDSTAPEQTWKMQYDSIVKNYSSDERYLGARGFDLRHELRAGFNLDKRTTLEAGWQSVLGGGTPVFFRSRGPVRLDILGDGGFSVPGELNPFSDGDFNFNLFANATHRRERFFMSAGVSSFTSVFFPVFSTQINPRVAMAFRFDSTWLAFGNFSSGTRTFPVHSINNSFVFNRTYNSLNLGGSSYAEHLERVFSQEIGIRRTIKRRRTDLVFFHQSASNLVRNGYFFRDSLEESNTSDADTAYFYGFANTPGKAMDLWGISLNAAAKGQLMKLNFRQKFVVGWHNELFAQYTQGREWFGHGYRATDDLRNFPKFMLQLRSALRVQQVEAWVAVLRQSSWLSGAAFYAERFQRPRPAERVSGFTTWDFGLKFRMSNHFHLYFQVLNAFNRQYGGIDATGTPDDLLYNPQQLRQAKFGISYYMQ